MTGHEGNHHEEAAQLLPIDQEATRRHSEDSISSASTTSLVFDRIGERVDAAEGNRNGIGQNSHNMVTPKFPPRGEPLAYVDDESASRPYLEEEKEEDDLETGAFINKGSGPTVDRK